MSHINTEHSQTRTPRIFSPTFDTINLTLTGSYTLPQDGAVIHYLDPGASDRDVFLPAILPQTGQFLIIVNMNTVTELDIKDSGGGVIVSVPPELSAIFFSHKTGWKYLMQTIVPTGIGTGDVVGPNSATDGAVALYNGVTGKIIKNSTGTEVTALLDVFTDLLKGLVPASGGGTADFLRADGTFAVPPGTGGVPDGDKGDITVSGGGLVWAIDADVVTYAKMQNIATDSLIGRDTAGTGDPETITLGASLSMTGALVLQRAALTGDVTAPVDSNTTTIANDAVTYAKMQNISVTARILGRITAGAGDTEELTGANVRTIAGLATTDSPEFLAINLGAVGDTTLTRVSAGVIAVEGVTIVVNTRQVVSGGGLTGGGDLSADRTLAVGAGLGITVNADDIAMTTNQRTRTITAILNGAGAALTAGVKGDLEIPFACTIDRVTLLADQSGSIVVDIWKDTYANYPPTVADTITAAAKPTITTAVKSQDATLTGWTTAIAAGDILRFNVDSATSIQRVAVSLRVVLTT